jgi:hypothetical protein
MHGHFFLWPRAYHKHSEHVTSVLVALGHVTIAFNNIAAAALRTSNAVIAA